MGLIVEQIWTNGDLLIADGFKWFNQTSWDLFMTLAGKTYELCWRIPWESGDVIDINGPMASTIALGYWTSRNHWLVVELATSLKNDGVSNSWDDDIPNIMGKSFKIPWFQSPPTSDEPWLTMINHH